MKQLTILLVLLSLSSFGLSASQEELDTFYANQENNLFYMKARSNGHLEDNRNQLVAACESIVAERVGNNAKAAEDSLSDEPAIDNCACYESELKNISDKELFFDNFTALRYQMSINEAKKNKDQALADQLHQKRIARNTVLVKLAKICGPM
jgi:hypothetical protein